MIDYSKIRLNWRFWYSFNTHHFLYTDPFDEDRAAFSQPLYFRIQGSY